MLLMSINAGTEDRCADAHHSGVALKSDVIVVAHSP